MKRIRSLILILAAAVAGAFAGHAFAEMREKRERGEDPTSIDPTQIRVRPQEVVAGVVAGFRVGEPPWSWLHIPGWVAAFAVTFATAAFAGDIQRLRDMFEHPGIGGAPRPEDEDMDEGYRVENGHEAPLWTAETPPPGSGPPPPPPPAGFTPFAD